ncbi:hypothetical protein Dimus_008312 [Dionaea muscipula]
MRRLRVENNRLMEELTSEKKGFIDLATASFQLKADVVTVTKENKTLEEENEKLKTALKNEKEKVKMVRERNVLLDNDLYDKTLKNDRLHTELNETYQRLTKIVEKRNLMEACLPKQMDFMVKEAQREYLESEEFQGKLNLASALILRNGWRLGLAQVCRVLGEDDPLIPMLDEMKIDVKSTVKARKYSKDREGTH